MSTSPRRIAIFGATSDIAVAFARAHAAGGTRFALSARDGAALDRLAQDLKVRGAGEVTVRTVDFADLSQLPAIAEAMWGAFGGLDVALIAYGSLPDQAKACLDPALAEEALRLNFTSPALLVNTLAGYFEAARAGTIAVITSVAGDRGRQSNYVYGGAKGGLQTFLDGVRHRLHASGVTVLDIRPGFVATKMTQHLPQTGPLWAQPDKVASDISAAIAKRRAVLYTPWFWWVIMTIVCALPRAVFHRSKL
ncbi:SDR family oxidoreductase [Ancylobacter pratisalsi]|uniref:SDR family oxidoreductase n=1 Tax=Ancylobacter pratisalsi TaxID=1745854 RepID=A0A6P1YRT4_9HYPH|nr:SDR family oxidoreductase [Ancylobacter pratisalsi]QIB35832.1 SDR family oxidoreductase [Ancylobacter pratisalsi]